MPLIETAADGDRERPVRRRAGARHADRGHSREQDDHGQRRRRRHEVGDAGQRQCRDRLAARRHARRLPSAARSPCGIPKAARRSFGTVPRDVTYNVAAIFEIGVYDYDKAFVVMPMQDAQDLLMMGDPVGMVEIQTTDPDQVGDIVAPLRQPVAGQGRDHRLAADELGSVPGASRSSAWRCSSCSRSSCSSPCSTSSPR